MQGIVFYIFAAVAGFSALVSYLLYSIITRERSLAAYANLIGAVSLLIIADGYMQYISDVGHLIVMPGVADAVKVSLTIVSNVWMAIVLPVCSASFSGTPLSRIERIVVAVCGVALAAGALAATLGGNGFTYLLDPIIFITVIAYSLVRLFLYRRCIPQRFLRFINISFLVHGSFIAGILLFYYVLRRSALSSIHFGFTVYYLAWNCFNIIALFAVLLRNPSSRMVAPAAIASAPLTPREKQIVELICEGRSNRYIADVFGITVSTVKNHMKNIFRKTGVRSRAGLIVSFGYRAVNEVSSETVAE